MEDEQQVRTGSPGQPGPEPTLASPRFSLDAWAVLAALFAALLIRCGLVPRVPW